MRRRQQGQSAVEYAVLITFVIAAAIGMSIYMKRGAMGKCRESIDQHGEQFSPNFFTSNWTTLRGGSRREETFANGFSQATFAGETQNKVGSENVAGNLGQENMW